MENKLKNKIIDTINFKSKELKISIRDGKLTRLKAVTFSQLSKMLDIDNAKNIEQLREIKKQLIGLVDNGLIVELESEPSFYVLKEEFDRKIGSKVNICGIEGFC